RRTGKKVFQGRGIESHIRIARSRRVCPQECNAATGIAVGRVRDPIAMELRPEFQRMLAGGVGNVIDELCDGVGPLELWPFEATQARKEVAAKRDARQSARKRTGDASVEPITGRGRVEIARQCRLGKAVVSNARFIPPAGTGSPRPTSANHLGARVNLRPPLRLQLRKVFHRPRVVPEEVYPAEAVVLVDV